MTLRWTNVGALVSPVRIMPTMFSTHRLWSNPIARILLSSETHYLYYPVNQGAYVTDELTYWGRVTHTCASKLTIIGSDNGLSPGQHQAIIWANAGVLLIGTLRTNFSEILSEIHIFKYILKCRCKMYRPQCVKDKFKTKVSKLSKSSTSAWFQS